MKTGIGDQACPCCSTPREMAESIMRELTTNAHGRRANRLQLRGPNEEDLGGMGWTYIVNVIARQLGEHPNCKVIVEKIAEEEKKPVAKKRSAKGSS